MLTDKQETAMLGLIERVARLEDFARRVSGVLAASGQALYLAKNVAEQVVPILTTLGTEYSRDDQSGALPYPRDRGPFFTGTRLPGRTERSVCIQAGIWRGGRSFRTLMITLFKRRMVEAFAKV